MNLINYFSRMKMILMLLVFLGLLYAPEVTAQRKKTDDLLVVNGTWKGDSYRDSRRNVVYRMEEDGSVKDKSGGDIIIVVGNSYRNKNNQVIGRFLAGEEIRNSSGRLLGRINKYGEIIDFYGNVLGELNGLTPQQAAVQFFLWNELIERDKLTRPN